MPSIRVQLELHEGLRAKPYADTVGKVTIGIGRNLTDIGLRPDEIELCFANDLEVSVRACTSTWPWFRTTDPIRQRVMIDMVFNMGLSRVKGFRKMLAAVGNGNYHKAAVEMLDSGWASQVGARALRLAEMMRTGKDYA